MSLRRWMPTRFLVASIAMGILFALLVAASVRLIASENELGGDVAEDMVWLSSQAQYEAVRFVEAAAHHAAGGLPLDEVQLRLDVLASRLSVLEQGEPRRQIGALGFSDDLAGHRAILADAAERIALIADDASQLEWIRENILALAQSFRNTANAALLAERQQDVVLRDRRKRMLLEILGALAATMLTGLLLAVILVRDQRNIANAEAALERERQVSKLHRSFISVVSHQFRTPIAIVDASAQRMIRRGASMSVEEISARAQKMRDACLRLTRLMESTLDAARLEEGEIRFNPLPCDVAQLLHRVCETQPDFEQGRIELRIADLPSSALVDETLLEQAVQNLVSNALKYSPQDTSITVEGGKAGEELFIRVRDRGVGIPADELGSLFQRFFRARTAANVAGTGIGLSFAAHILKLHGGTVEVESEEGRGSTFTLRLPYRPAEAPILPSDVAVSELAL